MSNRRLLLYSLIALLLVAKSFYAQGLTRKVLFIGNSYTGTNNLPQLVQDLARSAGDSLIIDWHTPGGFTLEGHNTHTLTNNKIAQGGWDYVVLQEQSQRPIVNNLKFRQGGFQLRQKINQHNPCAVTLLYMTWGRKNGDAQNCPSFPEMCTYQAMDSTLRVKYLALADLIGAEVSPVSVVWRNLRNNHPGLELYATDGSHPSVAGSYAAACSFYSALFKKDPSLITDNYSLAAGDAAIIRAAAQTEVFNQLALWDYTKSPVSNFNFSIGAGANEVTFSALNNGNQFQDYTWDFGDGSSSTQVNPTHNYAANGTYTATLSANLCNLQGLQTSTTDTVIEFCGHTPTISSSKPWLCQQDTLWTQPASQYQWYSGGIVLTQETNQYLTHLKQHGSFDFSVKTTVNGCTELSQPFAAVPFSPTLFFDAAKGGDPCVGDTGLITVHHKFNGYLAGNEVIRWYKNGNLLSAANNDTLLKITTQGIYTVKAVDPNAQCPTDTAEFSITFDCGSLAAESSYGTPASSVYPNPARTFIRLQTQTAQPPQEVQIYNATGRVIKHIPHYAGGEVISVEALPAGLYWLRWGASPKATVTFQKR